MPAHAEQASVRRTSAVRRSPATGIQDTDGRRSRVSRIPALAFAAAVAAALVLGWHSSEEGHLTPETGVGYWLGIAGAGAMLLLLLYPLRKRMRSLHRLGTVAGWFRLHMALGIIGPTLILFHSNFKLGSLNSNVALFSMLTVAGSGLIGRYLYARVHLGLYGRRAKLEELLADVDRLRQAIAGGQALSDELRDALDAYATRALDKPRGAGWSFVAMLALRLRMPRERARLMREVEHRIGAEAKRGRWSWRIRRRHSRQVRKLLRRYFAAVGKAATFAFYARLFALWHILHLPLFVLLVLAAVAHVLAVHLY